MFGIIIGLALLMFLAFKGMSIIWIAPICAMIVAITGGLQLVPTYTGAYMAGFVSFAQAWFPAFMLGAIFGKVMDESGAARSVAYWVTKTIGTKFTIAAVVLACGILAYGGVSVFVIVFAIYPLAVAMFREANISRRLIPGTIALGSFTFAMTAFPGTPQIQNLIPIQYFGTTPTAAPIIGVVAGLIMLFGGIVWLMYRERKFESLGIHFIEPTTKTVEVDVASLPNPLLSAVPLFTVVILLNVVKFSIVTSLVGGILVGVVLGFKRITSLIETFNAGASGSVIAIINTSAAVGFGAVVRAVPGFTQLTDSVLGIGGNPLISEALAINILAGATGSASGGMGIALAALGDTFVQAAATSGIPIEAFHRIASLSAGGLDALPHNGAILTVLAICGMTHKDSYLDMFVCAVAIPVFAVVVGIIMASVGIL